MGYVGVNFFNGATFDRRGESESLNNDARQGIPNDPNDLNGILHNSAEPMIQNTENNEIVSGNTTNLKLPAYVYRLGRCDRFACKLCNVRDDKWGMVEHYHAEGEGKKQ
jgi:hypothetical protein